MGPIGLLALGTQGWVGPSPNLNTRVENDGGDVGRAKRFALFFRGIRAFRRSTTVTCSQCD